MERVLRLGSPFVYAQENSLLISLFPGKIDWHGRALNLVPCHSTRPDPTIAERHAGTMRKGSDADLVRQRGGPRPVRTWVLHRGAQRTAGPSGPMGQVVNRASAPELQITDWRLGKSVN